MALNLDALRTEQARLNQQNTYQDKYVRLPEGDGTLVLRILPPKEGKDLFVPTRIHKLNGKNYHSPMTLVRGTWQGFCPMYTEYRRIWAEIEKLTRQGKMDAARELRGMADAIRPMERYFYNVIVRKEVTEAGQTLVDVGPKIWNVGKDLHSRILNAMLGNTDLEDPGFGDVTDYESGRDFRIRKKMKKGSGYPEYSESTFLQPSVAGTENQWTQWLANLWELEEERKIKPMDELQLLVEIFAGRQEDPTLTVSHPSVAPSPTPTLRTNSTPSPTEEDDFLDELRNL